MYTHIYNFFLHTIKVMLLIIMSLPRQHVCPKREHKMSYRHLYDMKSGRYLDNIFMMFYFRIRHMEVELKKSVDINQVQPLLQHLFKGLKWQNYRHYKLKLRKRYVQNANIRRRKNIIKIFFRHRVIKIFPKQRDISLLYPLYIYYLGKYSEIVYIIKSFYVIKLYEKR